MIFAAHHDDYVLNQHSTRCVAFVFTATEVVGTTLLSASSFLSIITKSVIEQVI
jgi:hypothetical protein